MRQFSRLFPVTALLFGLSFCFVTPSVQAAGIEGKWKVKIEPDDDAQNAGEKAYEDTLTFTPNKFSSQVGKSKGFDETDFEEDTRRFGPVAFKAEAKSENAGVAKWSGTVAVNEITGEMVWTKKDGTELRYTFKGSRI